ncbi:imidazole glycerol phosphate synthase subunit HisH [Pedobacter boryungensis]|uniref:Imidazole glycerol phosphate synthase subunit HisH n=1 Tax=Pedobacter boryungensis TaxID=869962 RepID=A0ABX2DF94_9SPHI|nr:imidazole glycerol phosphate synthase subunit HisH [Pedobacter boryungensis]NQX32763.1 imidazole glycerol phosphate synthase subunit HisH [Pedobacter boryungensis]
MKKIVVIDYGIGNVKSMVNALESLGVEAVLTANEQEIMTANAVILPGVGAFKHGMDNLNQRNLVPVIHDYVGTGKPFLGVCLGMQMLMEESEEFGSSKGLGLIEGSVKIIPLLADTTEKLPHVSWNELIEPTKDRWENTILNNTKVGTDMYFVHSFAAIPIHPSDVLANCSYGNLSFCAAVHKKNIYGTQFHPEKSGIFGLRILEEFIKLIN